MKLKTIVAFSLFLFATNVLAADHTVEMKNAGADGAMVFEPAILKVEVGDVVNFMPTDMLHNSESIAELIPEGATGWKGDLSKKVSITIDKEGVYVYQCAPHSIMAMVGVIVAGQASNLDKVKEDSADLSKTFVLAKDRLDKYLAEVE